MPTIPSSGGTPPDGEWIIVDNNGEMTAGKQLINLSETQLELINDIAQNRFAQGLNASSFDQIFYDIFVDESKIAQASNINISTGQNGAITLTEPKIDGFEDGDYTNDPEWTESFDQDTLTVQNNVVYEGNYALKLKDSQIELVEDLSPQGNTITAQVYLNSKVGDLEFFNWNNGGLDEVIVKSNGSGGLDLKTNNSSENAVSDYPTSEWIKIILEFDNSGNVSLTLEDSSGNQLGDTNFIPWSNISNFDRLRLRNNTLNEIFYDNIQYGKRRTYPSNGTVTSTTIDKGFTPSSLQIDADIETGPDTTVSVKAYDGNGNTVQFSESELGTEKTVSFSDSTFQTDVELSTQNGSKTPIVNDYGLKVVE